MSPKLNKVYLSGQVIEEPYEVPGRYRQFIRFRMALPKERNHRRSEPDTIVLEAAGRTGASIVLNVKKGQEITVEGRLRSTVLEQGDNRSIALLIRIESFSLHAELQEPPADRESEDGDKGERSGSTRRRGRSRRGRSRGPRTEGEGNAPSEDGGKSDGGAPQASAEAPAAESEAPKAAAPTAEAPPAPKPAPTEAPKAAEPAPQPQEPVIPKVQRSSDPALKEDMPF